MTAWLIQHTIVACVLVIIVTVISRCRLCSPAFRHVLWLAVLVKLMMPPLVTWPWTVPSLLNTPDRVNDPRPLHDLAAATLHTADDDAVKLPAPTVNTSFEMLQERTGVHEAVPPSYDFPEVVGGYEQTARAALFVWLAGAAAMAVFRLVHVFRFHRMLARADPAPAWLTRHVSELAETFGVRCSEAVLVPGIRTPELWCVGPPKLLWPARLSGVPDPARWRSVVAHEMAHLHRRDHYVAWLELVAGCVWWWHPLFWYVRNRLRENAELACDAWALRACPDSRRLYAEMLIYVSQLVSGGASPSQALTLGVLRRRMFERRLSMIMKDYVPCRVSLLGALFCLLLVMLALPAWSQGVAVPGVDKMDQEAASASNPFDASGTPGDVPVSEASEEPPEVGGGMGGSSNASPPSFGMGGGAVSSQRPKSLEDRVDRLEKMLGRLLVEVRALRNPRSASRYTSTRTTRKSAGGGGMAMAAAPSEKPVSGSTSRAAKVRVVPRQRSTGTTGTIFGGNIQVSKDKMEITVPKKPGQLMKSASVLVMPGAASPAPFLSQPVDKDGEILRLKQQVKKLEEQLKQKDRMIRHLEVQFKAILNAQRHEEKSRETVLPAAGG